MTNDDAAVTAFLQSVMGLEVAFKFTAAGPTVSAMLGWPEGPDPTVRLFGSGEAGLVEVMAVPEPIQEAVSPGIAMISFLVADLEARVERCRELGLKATDIVRVQYGDVDVSVASVSVGGLRFELYRYEGT